MGNVTPQPTPKEEVKKAEVINGNQWTVSLNTYARPCSAQGWGGPCGQELIYQTAHAGKIITFTVVASAGYVSIPITPLDQAVVKQIISTVTFAQ